jgi:hypothetical protein
MLVVWYAFQLKCLFATSTYIGNAQVTGSNSVSGPIPLFYSILFCEAHDYQRGFVHDRFTVLVSSRRIGKKGGGCEQCRYRLGTFMRPMVLWAVLSPPDRSVLGTVHFYSVILLSDSTTELRAGH